MSGIALTSESDKNYTVLGRGPDRSLLSRMPAISVVLLFRGRKYRRVEDIRKIASRNYFDTIVLLPRDNAMPVEEMLAEFSNLRIIFYDPRINEKDGPGGRHIHLAMAEAQGELVMVLWNGVDVHLTRDALARMEHDTLCYVPGIRTSRGTMLPSLSVPVLPSQKSPVHFMEPLMVHADSKEGQSLFPYDFSGIYVKERYWRSGGYHQGMDNPHWQKIEFGFRSRLWGEKIRYLPGFRLDYTEDPPAEDSTPDENFLSIYLRILAVHFTGDRVVLPFGRFWKFHRLANRSLLFSWDFFRRERQWIKKHSYNYRLDVRQMVELWGEEHVL